MLQTFISHRHADVRIADVIRKNLLDWGIEPKKIFQSSAVEHGPLAGAPLEPQIRKCLCDAKLLILIYTFADEDWSWCMYECGVATEAKPENMRVVVFQFTEDIPKVFQHLVRIKITKDDILKFATQFHKEEKFFPNAPAFRPDITAELLQDRAERLYDALKAVMPPVGHKVEYRWDFLRLALYPENVLKIEKEKNEEKAPDLIKGNCLVTYAFGKAFEHFGYAAFQENQCLDDLVRRWQEATGQGHPQEWVNELYSEIWRAVRNMPSEPPGKYFKSAVPAADWWFLPVVNIVKIEPDNKMEFDVYLYRQKSEKKQ
jgi:hypothetical protein